MFKQYRCAILERMGTRSRRFDPRNPDRKRLEERTCNTHRKNRGAKVMAKAWESHFSAGTTTPNLGVAFPDHNRNSGKGKRYRRRKTVRTRSDDSCGWHKTSHPGVCTD